MSINAKSSIATGLKPSTEMQRSAYDYKRGWASTAQPFSSTAVGDYRMISEAAASDFMQQARHFCKKNEFSSIEITHAEFKEFEQSPKNFREWLDDFCDEKNKKAKEIAKINGTTPISYDSRADFAIIGVRIKAEESAKRKTADGTTAPDRVVDYAGILLVALKQHSGRKNKISLKTQEAAMTAIENDPHIRGIKNLYWQPHEKTKFRAHYSLWEAKVPESEELLIGTGATSIIVEMKIEHESQMDIDKLTRKFINIGRDVERAQSQTSNRSGKDTPQDNKRSHKLSLDEEAKKQAIDVVGGLLYNRVLADAGFNQFINPQIKDNFAALPIQALLSVTTETIKAANFTSGSLSNLLSIVNAMDMFQTSTTKTNGPRATRK